MSQIVIRDYGNSDEDELIIIHDLARPIELNGSCDPRAFVPLRNDSADLDEFRSCRKLVACNDDQIHGFIGINDNEIGWLYVRPESSRRGIGQRLLNAAMESIQKSNDASTTVSVYVLDANNPAIALYESRGFRIVETFGSRNNGYPCTLHKMLSV